MVRSFFHRAATPRLTDSEGVADRAMHGIAGLEVASGVLLGLSPPVPVPGPVPVPIHARDARATFDRAVRQALRRPPCVVSFSGGRDSAAVLAAAVEVARAEGLQMPIPVSLSFAAVAASEEAVFQHAVVDHLGLREWIRIRVDGELDVLGDLVVELAARHGLLAPFNAHFHWPILQRASGGTVLTGIGGDEVLGPHPWARLAALLAGRGRPSRPVLRAASLRWGPERQLQARLGRGYRPQLPWLTASAFEHLVGALSRSLRSMPVRWDRYLVDHQLRERGLREGLAALDALAADCDARLVHPFIDPSFVGHLAALGGAGGLGDRAAAMRALFGRSLPDRVLSRTDKASFDAAFWTSHAASIAPGLVAAAPRGLVDADELRAHWQLPVPAPNSYLLAQRLHFGRVFGWSPLTG